MTVCRHTAAEASSTMSDRQRDLLHGRTGSAAWTRTAHAAVARWRPVQSPKNRILTHLVVAASRLWMQRLNTLAIEDEDRFLAARIPGRGLLTFSNHVSLFDDPLVTSCIFPSAEWSRVRWVAADALNFFGTPLRAAVFNAGKCVPVVRGAGVDQLGMKFLAKRLKAGDWVHIFPEGGRSRDLHAGLRTPLKTGLAELVRASRPIVLPFYHHGMDDVLPIGGRFPRPGKTVSVLFGEAEDSNVALSERSVGEISEWAAQRLLALQMRFGSLE